MASDLYGVIWAPGLLPWRPDHPVNRNDGAEQAGSSPDDPLSRSLKTPVDFLPYGVQIVVVGTEDFQALARSQDIFRQELHMRGIRPTETGARG